MAPDYGASTLKGLRIRTSAVRIGTGRAQELRKRDMWWRRERISNYQPPRNLLDQVLINNATSRRYWKYRFIKVSLWMFWQHPKPPNGWSWGSENIWYFLLLGKNICLLKRFLLREYLQTISFGFCIKYAWKICVENLFGNIFWALIPFKW